MRSSHLGSFEGKLRRKLSRLNSPSSLCLHIHHIIIRIIVINIIIINIIIIIIIIIGIIIQIYASIFIISSPSSSENFFGIIIINTFRKFDSEPKYAKSWAGGERRANHNSESLRAMSKRLDFC